MNRSSGRLAALLLVCVVVIWGANWPILKMGLAHTSPLWFAVLRMVLGVISFAAVLAPLGRLKLPARQDWPLVWSVSLLQMAAFSALINVALLSVPAGRSAILAYTTPLWVTPGAVLFLGERLTRARALGLTLGLAGVAVLFNPITFDWSKPASVWGNLMLMAAALVWAAAILHVRGHRWAGSPLDLAPWQMLVALPPLALLAWLVEGPPQADMSPTFLWVAAYNGPLATAFAFWAAITVTRMLPAITVSLAFLCVPVAGLAFSALILGEGMSAGDLLGLALVAGGVAVVAVGDAKR